MNQTIRTDRTGRVTLPATVLTALGIGPDAEVTIEITAADILIRPVSTLPQITRRIAAMDLPVADWGEMEREIQSGRWT